MKISYPFLSIVSFAKWCLLQCLLINSLSPDYRTVASVASSLKARGFLVTARSDGTLHRQQTVQCVSRCIFPDSEDPVTGKHLIRCRRSSILIYVLLCCDRLRTLFYSTILVYQIGLISRCYLNSISSKCTRWYIKSSNGKFAQLPQVAQM
jgi:hypothetical protein